MTIGNGEECPRVRSRPGYLGHSRFQILKLNILLLFLEFTTRLSTCRGRVYYTVSTVYVALLDRRLHPSTPYPDMPSDAKKPRNLAARGG